MGSEELPKGNRPGTGGDYDFQLQGPQWSVTYWRDGDAEVDFVVSHGTDVWALEVKSGRSGKQGGVEAFRRAYPKAKTWLIGADGVKLEEFFSRPAQDWFS